MPGTERATGTVRLLTRGRAADHSTCWVVGDGDPVTIIRPETVAPRTPTEILQQILARD